MPGIADLALGAAPIAGGALVGVLAGGLKGPDYRAMIKDDLELLDKMSPEDVELRAALKRSIDERIADLVASAERKRQLREVAASYQGNWRDFVLFVCVVLFTLVWWNVDHDRGKWLPMFVVLIVLCIVTFVYALRGTLVALKNRRRPLRRPAGRHDSAG